MEQIADINKINLINDNGLVFELSEKHKPRDIMKPRRMKKKRIVIFKR